VTVPVLPCPGWLWRGQCEPREEWSRRRAPAAAKEKVTGRGRGVTERGVLGKAPRRAAVPAGGPPGTMSEPGGGSCLGAAWPAGSVSEAKSGRGAASHRSRLQQLPGAARLRWLRGELPRAPAGGARCPGRLRQRRRCLSRHAGSCSPGAL